MRAGQAALRRPFAYAWDDGRAPLVRIAIALAICLMLFAGSSFICGVAYADDSSSAPDSHADAPVATDPFADAVEVDLDEGLYQIDVALEGGSGRASVNSPAELEVFNGRGVVRLVWSSSNYDYMIVSGKKYLPTNSSGNSMFVIPVVAYDEPVPVVGDTTAMSQAHEVDYTLTVTLASARLYGTTASSETSAPSGSAESPAAASSEPSDSGMQNAPDAPDSHSTANDAVSQTASSTRNVGLPWPWIVFIACVVASAVCIGVTIGILRGYRNR